MQPSHRCVRQPRMRLSVSLARFPGLRTRNVFQKKQNSSSTSAANKPYEIIVFITSLVTLVAISDFPFRAHSSLQTVALAL